MMGRKGPEDKLVDKMKAAAAEKYGDRLVIIRYPKGPYSVAGISDLLCCLDGAFVAVEAKAADGDMYGGRNYYGATDKQKAFLSRVEEAGGITAVCNSVEGFLETLARASVDNAYGELEDDEDWVPRDIEDRYL